MKEKAKSDSKQPHSKLKILFVDDEGPLQELMSLEIPHWSRSDCMS